MKGDKGPLQHIRTQATQDGVPAHKTEPITGEYDALKLIDPAQLLVEARSFLAGLGVNKAPDMPADGVFLVLGEPRQVERGESLAVFRILNEDIDNWGRVASAPGAGNKTFGDDATEPGVYVGDQRYVMKLDSGRDFYSNGSAMNLSSDGRIVFNAHAPLYSLAAYHEVLHSFQGNGLSTQESIREGIVEFFAKQFAILSFQFQYPQYYPGYQRYIDDTERAIRYTSLRTVAKAFFEDHGPSIEELCPLFYKPTNDALPGHQRVSGDYQFKGSSVSAVKTYMGQHAMKQQGSWYRKWCEQNSNLCLPTGAPPNGLVLPATQAHAPFLPPGSIPPPPPVK